MAIVEELKTRRWTRDEFYRMAEMGLFDGQRVELIEGEIVEKVRQSPVHFQCINLAAEALLHVFGDGYWIRQQGPLISGKRSEPEPDIAVVQGRVLDYSSHHPDTALLVVEVSDTTLHFDRGRKASLYAKAGIPEYWIANLKNRRLEVHRTPRKDDTKIYGYGYAEVTFLSENESITPLAAHGSVIRIADLYPPQRPRA